MDTRKELDAAEKGKRKADLVALRRLEAQRYLTIVGTMYSIKADMPRASWDRLRTFVNDRFRPSVRVFEVKK